MNNGRVCVVNYKAVVTLDAFTDVIDKTDEVEKGVQVNINSQWAYNLGWGNYNRSSKIESGFSDTVCVKLIDLN